MIRIQVPSTSLRGVDVSVVPMINIVFLLLLYFLVAGRLMDTSGPSVELPLGGAARSAAPATAVVHVDAGGRLSVDGRVLDRAGIAVHLAEQSRSGATHVVVRADARARATALHAVMQACREVGIPTFELTTVDTR